MNKTQAQQNIQNNITSQTAANSITPSSLGSTLSGITEITGTTFFSSGSGTTVSGDGTEANPITYSFTGSTGVNISGTPTNNQIAIFGNSNTIEGDSRFTWNGTQLDIQNAIGGTSTIQPHGAPASTYTITLPTGNGVVNLQQSNAFQVIDFSDLTKVLTFDVSNISTITTRTATFPDRNIDFSSGGTFSEYGEIITGMTITGTTTKTISLSQRDGNLIQANFTDETGGSSTTLASGTTIVFTSDSIYNSTEFLTNGNLTLDVTGGVAGSSVLCYCREYAPEISGATYYKTSGNLDANALNVISFLYDGTQVLTNISNIAVLTPPVLTLTPSDQQLTVNWGAVLNAETYTIEMDTNSGFTASTEVYNSTGITTTVTGLTNGTTYYFRGMSNADGQINSNFGDTATGSPSETVLLGHWTATDDSSITTSGGSVSSWLDQTANDNDLTEGSLFPTHSAVGDTIDFDSTGSGDRLTGTFSDFYFQQTDDFSVFIKNLTFSSSSSGANVINCKENGPAEGWAIQLSSDNLNLYWAQRNSSTQNLATANNVSGWDDDVARDWIFINESSTLKIYDSTNTLIASGTTVTGAINYTSVDFYVGQSSTGVNPMDGSMEEIKIWSGALNETERNTELGL